MYIHIQHHHYRRKHKGNILSCGAQNSKRTCAVEADSPLFLESAQLTVGAFVSSLNSGVDIFCLAYSAHAWL